MDKNGEPPSSNRTNMPLFLVGKDSHGHWVVRDQSGLRGGLFVDRTEALKYAMFENGRRPQAVVMVPGILELDMSVVSNSGAIRPSSDPKALLQRWAA
jgi:hypothetical protein